MPKKIGASKLKVSTLDDLTVVGFENTKNNNSFLDKKKFIMISLCIIISVVLIVLTILYALKIDFVRFFKDIHKWICLLQPEAIKINNDIKSTINPTVTNQKIHVAAPTLELTNKL